YPLDLIAAVEAAELEDGGNAQRYGHDRLREIALVAILVERQLCAGNITIHQAGIGGEVMEAGFVRGTPGETLKRRGHRGPRAASLWVDPIVAIAPAVGDP